MIRIFISYAHEDEGLLQDLEKQLRILWRQGIIDIWHDRMIVPGANWQEELDKQLNEAEIILLLVSPDFVASDYCYGIEMQRALQRHADGRAVVIPIILRPVLLSAMPFSHLQILPVDAMPITKWRDRDEAFLNVAEGIRRAVRSKLLANSDSIHGDSIHGAGNVSIGLVVEGDIVDEQGPDTSGSDEYSPIAPPQSLPESRQVAVTFASTSLLFQAVETPSIFVGRNDECATLEKEIQSSRKVTVIRSGLGGIGKTTLASHLAHHLRDSFADGVLWTRVDLQDTKDIMLTFIESLGINSVARFKHLSTNSARATYYRSILSEKQCLIVLDNADTAEQVVQLVPFIGPSQVIVTTRYAIASAIPGAFELQLDVLSSAAACDLFLALSNRESWQVTASTLTSLVSLLGNLPLAIRIAASIVRDLQWSIEDYFTRLNSSSTLDWVSVEDDPISVRRSFDISYHSLSSEISKQVFRILGIFLHADIQTALISHVLGCSLHDVERSILALVRRGLIEIETHKPTQVLIHPLMKRYMKELLAKNNEEQRVHALAASWYRDRISMWRDEHQQFEYGVLGSEADASAGLQSVFHYYQAGLYDHAQQVLVGIADTVSLQGREDTLLKYLTELHPVISLVPWLQLYRCKSLLESSRTGEYEEGMNTLRILAKSSDFKVASSALIYLSNASIGQHRYGEARRLLKMSLRLKRQLIPPDLKGITYIRNQLALISLQTGGSPSDVLKQYEQVLQLQRQISDAKGIAYTLFRIAMILLRRLNESEQAREMLIEAEKVAKESGSKIVLVFILVEKAEVLRRNAYFADAIAQLTEALEIAEHFDNPFPEAHVLRQLALAFERVELYGDSLKCIEKSSKLLQDVSQERVSKTERIVRRIRAKTRELEEELRQIEISLVTQEQAGDRRSLRIMRRRRKRLRQKLGLEPALIRLGNHSI